MSLNLRLVAVVVALLAVIIGGIAVISTRVAHVEIRKVVTTAEVRAQLKPGQTLRGYYENFATRQPDSNIAIFDASRRLVGATVPLYRVTVDPSDFDMDRITDHDSLIYLSG